MTATDPYDLQRFVKAQQTVYPRVVAELDAGRKRSHWMWFIFPQIAGLGHSAMAQHYAIGSRGEATAYLAHPVLGPRLIECTGLVNKIAGRTAEEIFGYPDDMKFRSSMTLFAEVVADRGIFEEALRKYFDGAPDPLTLERLGKA